DLAVKVAGAGLATLKIADKITALKKIEAVEKAAVLDRAARPKLTIKDHKVDHQAFVNDLVKQLKDLGYQVGANPYFKVACGTRHCKPDIIYRTPSGKVSIIEVKTGNAGLSNRQGPIFEQIRDGNSIPTGRTAEKLGLTPGIPLKDQGYPNGIPIYEQRFPGAG
ncbi:hypothetical protein, partial [Phyllobacterium endophyticum]|uniref:hypothetical protein n=1 Tax=Phyllobacterium endophyticum TaxID=1149773 RepID=UPI00164FDDE8